MNLKPIIPLSLLVLTLIACSRTATPAPDAQTSPQPPKTSVSQSPLSPLPTSTPQAPERTSPLSDPASSPLEPAYGAADQAVAAAMRHLANELGTRLNEIEVIAIEPVDWPDASLGCPQPGKAYAQVVTPGYRIVLEADGKEYELHTDQSGSAIAICQPGLERDARAGVAYLAGELGISVDEVEVVSVETYEWPDASLGCPQPGKSYAQVVTTGYRLILRAEGERYEVHTDRRGQTTVICDTER